MSISLDAHYTPTFSSVNSCDTYSFALRSLYAARTTADRECPGARDRSPAQREGARHDHQDREGNEQDDRGCTSRIDPEGIGELMGARKTIDELKSRRTGKGGDAMIGVMLYLPQSVLEQVNEYVAATFGEDMADAVSRPKVIAMLIRRGLAK